MAYGYTLTAAGRTLLLQLQAGNSMTISRIAVGDGEVPEDINPATLTGLVHEVERSQATCTVPVVEADTLSFEVEYRNKWDTGTFGEDYTDPTGLTESFWLREYAVFALDADGNEIMLYYASLGDFPEAVAKWNGRNLVSKRYPVSISIVDDDTDVQLVFPARAFITSDYLEERLSAFSTKATEQLNTIDKLVNEAGRQCTIVSETEPTKQSDGDLWLDTSDGLSDNNGENIVVISNAVVSDTEPDGNPDIWLQTQS